MSEPSDPTSTPAPAWSPAPPQPPAPEDLEVDPTAFLPEGVAFGDPDQVDEPDEETSPAVADEAPDGPGATDETSEADLADESPDADADADLDSGADDADAGTDDVAGQIDADVDGGADPIDAQGGEPDDVVHEREAEEGDVAPSEAVAEPPKADLSALEGIEDDLRAVDAALAALDAGTYGSCRVCGNPVEDVLLAEDPTRATCAAHA